jgi:hypothetical protein
VNGQLVGLDFVDTNIQLGLEYFKGVIAQAKKEVSGVAKAKSDARL